jgi:hypothetical protein
MQMASSGKQKTTWSKIQRESALRERRQDKAARKAARKFAAETELSEAANAEATEAQAGAEDAEATETAAGTEDTATAEAQAGSEPTETTEPNEGDERADTRSEDRPAAA